MSSAFETRGEFEQAIVIVQQCVASGGPTAEWTGSLNVRLKGLSEVSGDLRRILERHGWARGQFRCPPDRERLLRDLAAVARRRTPNDDTPSRAEDRRLERQYVIEEKPVGEGTYGTVYKARCMQTQKIVAVKKVKMEQEVEGVPSTAIREIAVLKGASHPNIVKLLDVCCTPGRLHLIFEFVELNLKQYMKRHNFHLEPATVRALQQQLIRGIDYCHSHRIMHRDLKPQNILIDGAGVKIADFGMARAFMLPIPRYTHEVVTTWYRAPEILFGSETYSLPVDVWSAGCIFGEIATGTALFHGDSEIDTIFRIFQKLGTPTETEWPGLAQLPEFKPTFPKWMPKSWKEIRNVSAQLGPDGIALLDGMLRYYPKSRISVRQALSHPYFVEATQFIGIETTAGTTE